MSLHRLTSITLGVPDPTASGAFYEAFGLSPSDEGWLATRDGGDQIRLEPAPQRSLLRLGVGAEDPDDLDRLAQRLDQIEVATRRVDDALFATDPATGLVIEVTIAGPLETDPIAPVALNSPGVIERVNYPAAGVTRVEPVRPSNLTHVVWSSPDQPATLRFFTEGLGFEISDSVDGIVAFTRCGEVHHNVAIQAGPVPYLHHIAFEVDDVDEVARGGSAMIQADPDRHVWGLGRHAIGSNWFWYLREPSGTYVEYAADVDRISDQDLYRPKEWDGHELIYSTGPPPPAEFLEPPDLADLVQAHAQSAGVTGG